MIELEALNWSFEGGVLLVYCITDISPNNLYKFSSAALSSIDVATATPHSSALQTENLSCVI